MNEEATFPCLLIFSHIYRYRYIHHPFSVFSNFCLSPFLSPQKRTAAFHAIHTYSQKIVMIWAAILKICIVYIIDVFSFPLQTNLNYKLI